VPTERFQFEGVGGHQLAASLDLPTETPMAYALFAHCFTCGKDSHGARRIAIALAAKGIAVLRFDFTGLGSSEGDFANANFSSNVTDLVRAADHLRQTRKAPAILIGHSLGGAAMLAAAGQIPDAKAVVTIAAPSARSMPAGSVSPSGTRNSSPGSAARKCCSRSAESGWRKAKVWRIFVSRGCRRPCGP